MAQIQFLNANELDNSYENQIDFDDITAQNSFWLSQAISVTESPISISTSRLLSGQLSIDVGIPFKDLSNINYLRIYQDSKYYYLFINSKDYINENATRLNLELDVFQTFMFDFTIGESFIEREHQDRYNIQGKPIFSLTDENIEVGENLIKKSINKIYDNVPENFSESQKFNGNNLFWAKIITKENLNDKIGSLIITDNYKGNDTNVDTTLVNSLPTNIYYYVAPVIFRPAISIGTSVFFYVNSTNSFTDAIPVMTNRDFLALSQDTRIISISLSRYCPFEYDGLKRTIQVGGINIDEYVIRPQSMLEGTDYSLVQYKPENKYNPEVLWGGFFRMLSIGELVSSKELTGLDLNLDISLSELSINNAKNQKYEPKLYHQEFTKFVVEFGLQKQVIDIMLRLSDKYKYISSYSINNSEKLSPKNYASDEINGSFEFGLKIDGSDTEQPLRSNEWLQYLSQHKNALVTGLTGNLISNTIGTGLQFAFGGPVGAVGGIRTAFESGLSIAEQLSKVKDLKNTPDTISKPSNDYIMNFLEEDMFFKEKIFQIPESMLSRVYNYLFHFGYRCNDFKVPNLKSRYYFNYIKTNSVNIESNLNNTYINSLSNIFNKGITIWHYRNASTWKGVNNFTYENCEMTLI